MTFLEEVRADREPLAGVLKRHRGIRKLVEDLYPDRAHFIYELLQNAEDAGATAAAFVLSENSLSFEHDGRDFTGQDIWDITDIGESGKEGKIGRFGIGFKAVFGYSETPRVWSPTFSFEISELVLPTEITARASLGRMTRFEFPFNTAKKNPQQAHTEVQAGLEGLAETTLLFLSHLKSISWQIDQKRPRQIVRITHADNHIEVQKRADGKPATSSHFLRFSKPVEGLEKQSLSIAFALDLLPNLSSFESGRALWEQLKIVPAIPGRVAVFFPAEKEASGLRFHLHAPFVPELSRASIKDTPKNEPLFKELAKLAANSLHRIRDLKLLTGDFLGVLPNPQDSIPIRYQQIRLAIVEEMNNKPLTPTHSKSYAPARCLLQAEASLKDLLSPQDIDFLHKSYAVPSQWAFLGPLQWAIAATQKNQNTDRFLSSLEIKAWDVDTFVGQLKFNLSEGQRPDPQFLSWLATKPLAWHHQLYLLLYRELREAKAITQLSSLKLVRLNDGNYSVGSKCYFPSDCGEDDKLVPHVEKAVYSSGKNETDKQDVRALLFAIGVREVGEPEQVQAILKQRYTAAALRPELIDLKRFIALFEIDKIHAKLFSEYYVIKNAEGKWLKPSQIYLDSPIVDTGLTAFYDSPAIVEKRTRIAPSYADLGLPPEAVRRFLEAIGVRTRLEVAQTTCGQNPEWRHLSSVPGERSTSPIDKDFFIPALDKVLVQPTVALSNLVWRTMFDLPGHYLEARFQKNTASGFHVANSQLVHTLRKCAWVPQSAGKFVRPTEAESSLLPHGFPFDPGDAWIQKVQFGEANQQRSQQNEKREAVAKEMGLPIGENLERALQFAKLPQAEQIRILASTHHSELPEHQSPNPDRRAEQVAKQAATAPERTTEQRMRSVSINREDIKQQTRQYLRGQYTNADGEMFCQVCQGPLPFKLNDGTYYFEATEFLKDRELILRHYQDYLALCPNHAAMFNHANGSRDALKAAFTGMEGSELQVILAREDMTICFTKTHIADLKTVIETDNEHAAPKGNTAIA